MLHSASIIGFVIFTFHVLEMTVKKKLRKSSGKINVNVSAESRRPDFIVIEALVVDLNGEKILFCFRILK